MKKLFVGLFFVCVVSFFALSAEAQTSFSPVVRGSNGHFYQIVRPAGGVTQNQAISLAQTHIYNGTRGVISSLQTLTEYEDVVYKLRTQRNISLHGVWVSGYKYGGVWRWSTGASLIYSRWAPGEPNNTVGRETSLCLWDPDGRSTQTGGFFADISLNARLGYMVEYN